ncbi:hypothetical protein Vadar_016860 [Vaccinium darrowii]|uniref:Uncharacterized protein n=1 Tax=Vaccinium darrowii TaxID=229202 RepID=A0ACB7Y8L1_9ERIC|nr:hypothetical protein Vadar_016860 [Vaccinium darrowii]
MTMEEEKNGEALISSLLKTTTMTTEDEEIGPTLTSPCPCFLKSPSIVPESSPLLGSESMEKLEFEDFMNYDKKACEMEEGDNGLNENYIPTEVVEPKCGMIFDTAEEAYTFYNRYARKIGFSVRKLRTNNSRADQNKILRQVLVCSCDGAYKKIKTPKKRRENRRFNCKALLEFKISGDKYHIIQFISEHTHDLVPPQNAHYLRSQRRIEFSQVGLIDKMHSSGFKPSDIYSYMSTEVGAEKYTKKVFYLFQREFQQTLDLSLKLEHDDGTIGTYIVKELEGWEKIRKLAYNRLEHSVSCTCRKFEFYGILCSHALKLFRDLQYESLPPQYYLKRWTRTIIDEDVFDIPGDLIPNDTDPSLTLRYSDLSQISQRIVTKGSKSPKVSSLTKAGLLELEAKVDSWVSSKSAVQNDASKAQSTSTLNVDVEAPLRDPAKRKRRGQGNKRKRGPLEGKLPKKKTPCKRKGGKGEDSTTEAMTKTSQPFKEVEQDENTHDTTSAQGPHVEQPNMAQRSPFQSRIMEANVGMNGLQVPNSSCTSWRASHLTFTEMLLGEDREIEESLGDGGFETCFDNVLF